MLKFNQLGLENGKTSDLVGWTDEQVKAIVNAVLESIQESFRKSNEGETEGVAINLVDLLNVASAKVSSIENPITAEQASLIGLIVGREVTQFEFAMEQKQRMAGALTAMFGQDEDDQEEEEKIIEDSKES